MGASRGPSPARGGRPFAGSAALALSLSLALLGVGGLGGCKGETAPVTQPMAFNHAIHIKQDLTCLDCHNQADKGPHATTLTIDGCMKCHAEVKEGEDASIQAIRDTHAKGEEIRWKWVNRLVGHVYFSHEAHVKYGEMQCQDCHGKVEETTTAFTTSQVENLTMDACITCHQEREVETDCGSCHK